MRVAALAQRARGSPVTPDGTDITARLMQRLRAAGITFEQMRHRPVYTSAEAAEVRGALLRSGAKALVLKAGDAFVMAVIPADRALDSVALRRLLGCKRLRFASRDELIELTGLEPGAVPPFGSLFELPTIVDEALAENERINFNAAGHSVSIQMRYDDYVALEVPRIAAVTKSP